MFDLRPKVYHSDLYFFVPIWALALVQFCKLRTVGEVTFQFYSPRLCVKLMHQLSCRAQFVTVKFLCDNKGLSSKLSGIWTDLVYLQIVLLCSVTFIIYNKPSRSQMTIMLIFFMIPKSRSQHR